MTMSQTLKAGISFPIRLGIPFSEGGERIIHRLGGDASQNDFIASDCIGDLVAFFQMQGRSSPATDETEADIPTGAAVTTPVALHHDTVPDEPSAMFFVDAGKVEMSAVPAKNTPFW